MFSKPIGIPHVSGCYLFRNDENVIIYVGKAKSLRNRLSNYFQKIDSLDAKTQNLMAEASSVEWIITPSEFDALVLENELIKVNQPRYNLRLKDDKTYPFVAIDKRSAFAVPYITRGKHLRGNSYFGPFVDVSSLRRSFDELLQVYPLRTCTNHKFEFQKKIGKPCLLFDIGRCPGPCVDKVSNEDYAGNVKAWEDFFSGDVATLKVFLNGLMNSASKNRQYEAAQRYRDGIEALDRAASSQVVILDDYSDIDVVAIVVRGGRAVVSRYQIRFGRIVGRTIHFVDRALDESELEIFLATIPSMYPESSNIPSEIVVQNDELLSDMVVQYLQSLRTKSVKLTCPKRGKKLKALELALVDTNGVLDRDSLRRTYDHNTRTKALTEIQQALRLNFPPYRMECFDMSHLQGTNYVGSMVVFEDGMPQKSHYRRFNVKEATGNDDAGAMREVLRRRLEHWDDPSGKFPKPDLIVIDGGLPQLHAVEKAIEDVGLEKPPNICSLAKREELIYVPGSNVPIALPRGSEGLYLMQRLRDEAHRFAITFHKSKRNKQMISNQLERIEGLGENRIRKLLEIFGSLESVRSASFEELRSLNWLPSSVAKRLYDELHSPRNVKIRKNAEES